MGGHGQQPTAAESTAAEAAASKQHDVRNKDLLSTNSLQIHEKILEVIKIQSLLQQFAHPQVRADFVNGLFDVKYDDQFLSVLDKVRWTLFPRWMGGPINANSEPHNEAADHLQRLMEDDDSDFILEEESYQVKYSDWFKTLNTIAGSDYWSQVPPESRCTHIVPPVRSTETDKVVLKKHSSNSGASQTEGGSPEKSSKDKKKKTKDKSKKKKKGKDKSKSKKEEKIEEIIISSTDSSDSSSSESSSSADSEESEVEEKKSHHRRSRDRREVVTPPPFRMDGKITLREHLDTYESYFDNKFKGNSYDKTQQLSEFLDDELLALYKVRGGRNLKYEDMKTHLLDYYKKQKIGGKKYWRRKFEEATVESDEQWDLYGLRLMEMAELAFPSDKKECATQLRERFLKTLPPVVTSKVLDTERAMKATTDSKKKHIPFKSLLQIARDLQKSAKEQTKAVMLNNMQRNSTVASREFRSRRFSGSNSTQPRQSSSEGSTSSKRPNSRGCAYCGHLGHTLQNCWKAARRCLICGDDHILTQCPKFNPSHKSRNSSNNSSNNNKNNSNVSSNGNNQLNEQVSAMKGDLRDSKSSQPLSEKK